MGSKKLLIGIPCFLLGMILLAGGIWSAFSLKSRVDQGTSGAKALDKVSDLGMGGGGTPDPCFSMIAVQVVPAQRVMAYSDTQVLTATLTNHDRTLTCNENIAFDGPEFDPSPASSLSRLLTIPPGEKRSLSWIIEPRREGTFQVGVDVLTLGIGVFAGITVTNAFGLTIWQAQMFSYISSFLGAFFGPVLSFTWWYRIWKKRRRKKVAPTLSSSTRSSTLSIRPQAGPVEKFLTKKTDDAV